MNASAVLEVDRDGDIAILVLNRPDKMNAMNLEMLELLATATEAAAQDCSFIVVTGAGGNIRGPEARAGLDRFASRHEVSYP